MHLLHYFSTINWGRIVQLKTAYLQLDGFISNWGDLTSVSALLISKTWIGNWKAVVKERSQEASLAYAQFRSSPSLQVPRSMHRAIQNELPFNPIFSATSFLPVLTALQELCIVEAASILCIQHSCHDVIMWEIKLAIRFPLEMPSRIWGVGQTFFFLR